MKTEYFFQSPELHFDNLDDIEFKDKLFYLSGNFIANGKRLKKEDFARKINSVGGICQDLSKKPRVKPESTDFLVIGDKDYLREGDGNNYRKIKQWNDNKSNKYIPIIRQSHCEYLIEKYSNNYKPQPY